MDERLRRAVERAAGAGTNARWRHVGATGWGDAWRIESGAERFFVKLTSADQAAMLDAEADGLRALAQSATIRVPKLYAAGAEDRFGYLVVEWLNLSPLADGAALGSALARMHRATPPAGPRGERYGWFRDNFLGATAQANGWCDDWATFFVERRLAPQFALAAKNGYDDVGKRFGERVLQRSHELLRRHECVPSLVHGDLWSGNAGSLPDGAPVVFDPAVHVGNRESDLAMTELFGAFGDAFMRAYSAVWPLDADYPRRRTIYHLYHLLNHLNLFGRSYQASVERSIDAILAAH